MNQKYKAEFGVEVAIPAIDKNGRRWGCDDLEKMFTAEGHVYCTSTGGIVDTSGPPSLIRKDDGKLYANPDAHHHVIDAQGYTKLTNREEVEHWLDRLLQSVNRQFDYDEVNECPRIDYWLWVYPQDSKYSLLYEWHKEDGLWHSQEEHDEVGMPEALSLAQLNIVPGW